MHTRIAAGCAVLLAAAVAALGGAAAARAANYCGDCGRPTPYSPAAAYAYATAPSATPSGSTTSLVDGSTALSASTLPGAATSVESDLTIYQAVGLAPLYAGATSPLRHCWANAAWHQWGWWPYEQRITDTTYWCAIYGSRITYRTSSVSTSGTICGTNWRATQLIGGGVGYSSMKIRSTAGFACQTDIPWVTLHPSHYEDVLRNDYGATSEVGSG